MNRTAATIRCFNKNSRRNLNQATYTRAGHNRTERAASAKIKLAPPVCLCARVWVPQVFVINLVSFSTRWFQSIPLDL